MPTHPNWVFSDDTTWTMKEKLGWSEDNDFEIMDEEGNVVIMAKAANFWKSGDLLADMKDAVTFIDTNTNEELFKIEKKFWSLTPTYQVIMKGKTVAVLSKTMFSLSDRLNVYAGEDKSAPVIFTVKKPWVCGPYTVGYSNRRRDYYEGEDDDADPVASTKEERCNASGICGMDEYQIDIDAGVDALMIFAVQVAIDQMTEDAEK